MRNKINPPILAVISTRFRFTDFAEDFQEISKDFLISTEISRFHEGFQDLPGDFRQGVRDFRKWRTPRSPRNGSGDNWRWIAGRRQRLASETAEEREARLQHGG